MKVQNAKSHHFIYVDTETTGLPDAYNYPAIIELGALDS